MIPLRFAIDLDEVLADTNIEILRRYNRDWGDTLTIEDMTDWKLSKIVKPEGAHIAHEYYGDHDLYDYVKPKPHAKEAVDNIRAEGHTVVIVTSCVLGTEKPKIEWLIDYGFVKDRSDVIIADKKYMIRADVLIDDKPEHLILFRLVGGLTVAFDHLYNRHVETTHRITSWQDDIVNSIKAKVFKTV